MTSYRRNTLSGIPIQPDTHAGLWLDKYLDDDNDGSKDRLVHEVAGIKTSDAYKDFYKRWVGTLAELGAIRKEAKVVGRMAVNLGSEAVLETAIALHHTYGVPFIPGSALKGLATHYVLKYQDKAEWGRDVKNGAFQTLFGDTTSAGYVTFYDALYVPDSGWNSQALWKDVITVHHPDYYQGNQPPADWDSPVPIPFITATGNYLIALSGPQKWVETAFQILELALEREGVGAKTSSGYGRLSFGDSDARQTGNAGSTATHAPATPPKNANWKIGKISNDGNSVQPIDHPEQKLSFHREHVLPKGYTPARKAEVEYTEETLADKSTRVWVKQKYYPVN